MSKHTPGPWHLGVSSSHADCDFEIYDDLGQSIAHVSCRDGAEAQANAALLLASPKMLAVLEEVLAAGVWPDLYNRVHAVVSEARGES